MQLGSVVFWQPHFLYPRGWVIYPWETVGFPNMTFEIRVPVAYALIQSSAAAFPKLGKLFSWPVIHKVWGPPSFCCSWDGLSGAPVWIYTTFFLLGNDLSREWYFYSLLGFTLSVFSDNASSINHASSRGSLKGVHSEARTCGSFRAVEKIFQLIGILCGHVM